MEPDIVRKDLDNVVSALNAVNVALYEVIPRVWQISDDSIEDVTALIAVLKELYSLHNRLEAVHARLQGSPVPDGPDLLPTDLDFTHRGKLLPFPHSLGLRYPFED